MIVQIQCMDHMIDMPTIIPGYTHIHCVISVSDVGVPFSVFGMFSD